MNVLRERTLSHAFDIICWMDCVRNIVDWLICLLLLCLTCKLLDYNIEAVELIMLMHNYALLYL